MSRVPIDKLRGGMILLRPVTNKAGMVILGQGMELTERLIGRLSETDITGAYIQGMSEPSVPREEALAGLDGRFRNVEGEPYMDFLKRAVKKYIEGLYAQS